VWIAERRELRPLPEACSHVPDRAKQGSAYALSGICNGLQITGFPREAGQRKRGKFRPETPWMDSRRSEA
jgi:hypothetical protein